jgi:hypothetical protein
MTFNVIERDANFLGVLIDGAAIGPFESERTAREWLKGFGFTSNVEVAVHRERVEGRGNMLERRVPIGLLCFPAVRCVVYTDFYDTSTVALRTCPHSLFDI